MSNEPLKLMRWPGGVWVTKRNIRGVVSTQATATNRDAMTTAFAAREIEHVANDHIFVRVVRPHSVGRVNRFIVKTFEIYRIRAVDRDFTLIDIVAHRTSHAKILVLIVTAERSREDDQRQAAAVPENEHFNFTAQPGCVPFDVTFVHVLHVISSEAEGEKSLLQIAGDILSPQSSPRTGRGGTREFVMLKLRRDAACSIASPVGKGRGLR